MSKDTNGIDLKTFSLTMIVMIIVVILASIKIYISNQIYYESRNINKLEARVIALRQEKKTLQTKLEKLKFEIEVVDTIFSLDDDKEEAIGAKSD